MSGIIGETVLACYYWIHLSFNAHIIIIMGKRSTFYLSIFFKNIVNYVKEGERKKIS